MCCTMYMCCAMYMCCTMYMSGFICQTRFSVLWQSWKRETNLKIWSQFVSNIYNVGFICCYIILESFISTVFLGFACLCVPLSVCLSDNQSVEFTPYTCESKGGANFGLITNSTAVYNPFKGKKFFYLHVAELSL